MRGLRKGSVNFFLARLRLQFHLGGNAMSGQKFYDARQLAMSTLLGQCECNVQLYYGLSTGTTRGGNECIEHGINLRSSPTHLVLV